MGSTVARGSEEVAKDPVCMIKIKGALQRIATPLNLFTDTVTGKQNAEAVSGRIAVCPNVTVMLLCNSLGNGKAQSKAAAGCARTIGAVKSLEDLF